MENRLRSLKKMLDNSNTNDESASSKIITDEPQAKQKEEKKATKKIEEIARKEDYQTSFLAGWMM